MELIPSISSPALRLFATVGLSAALHVAGFAWLSSGAQTPGASVAQGVAADTSRGVTLRLVDPSQAEPALIEHLARDWAPVHTPLALATLTPAPEVALPSLMPTPLATQAAEGVDFLPPSKVDRQAYPLNPPDLSFLARVSAYSGAPMRLRLYVDATGRVAKTEILFATDTDRPTAELIAEALSSVAFVPARSGALEVPAYLNAEFDLSSANPTSAGR
jgi:hypothetical protein